MTPGRDRQPVPSHRFRPDIEGLRAVAIGSVLLAHAGVSICAGGYVGVDVFFVISGFLITGLLLGELDRSGHISLSKFYARRIKRLLPLSALLLGAVAVLTFLILSPLRASEVSKDIISSAFYTANWHFAAQSVDYFAQDIEPSPVQHLWSLAIEEQFYLVWPTLLLGVAWVARSARASLRTVLWGTLAVLFTASLLFGIHYTSADPPAAYFSTLGRAWELALGAALALLGTVPLRRNVAAVLGWAGFAAILYAVLFFDELTPFPGVAALVPTLGAAALIVAGGAIYARGEERVPAWTPAALLGTSPARYVGRISYSWYLWHWPALVFAAALWGPLSTVAGLAVVAASWIPTALSHYIVEEPFRRSKKLVQMPSRAFALGAACTAIAVVSALTLVDLEPTLRTASLAEVKGAAALRENPALQVRADAVRPNPLDARTDRPQMFEDGCLLGTKGTKSGKCLYGDPDGEHTVFLFGDSHAMQYFPAIDALADKYHWRLIALTKAECSPAEAELWSRLDGQEYKQCDIWRERALQRIEDAGPGATIVMSSDTDYEPYVDGEQVSGATASEVMEAAYIETLDRIKGNEQNPVVIRDPPTAPEDVPSCVSAELEHLDNCAFAREHHPNEDFDLRAARATKGTVVIDLIPEICPDDLCRAVIGNALVYRDKNHLTATFAATLTPWIEDALVEAGLA